MSAVERALKKLQEARVGQAPNPTAPVARVVDRGSADEALGDQFQRHIELDFGALGAAGLYSQGNQRLVDEYRAIKQPLLRKAAARHPNDESRNNLIMVASSIAGEGKTFTSVNLSLSLANEKDWRVLLVDVDCKKPHLSQLLGIKDQPGLIDLLKDPSLSLDSLVIGTNVEGLAVLALGAEDAQSAELLGSGQMSALCTRLAKDTRRIVIFDSSPLLLTTEAPILCTHVGQVVMVVLAGKTPKQAVSQAIEKLDPTKAIGVVLNQVDEGGDGYRYGYGYGYGYGGAAAPDKPPSS